MFTFLCYHINALKGARPIISLLYSNFKADGSVGQAKYHLLEKNNENFSADFSEIDTRL